ncbi:MAG: ATP-binding cassette domain-containing protein [Treponema sp.]|nr:ATP-binding cassette domain-containing protein [Treponema sp.]
MKKFCQFLQTRPAALVSLVVIALLYMVMIFAEFVAPYSATMSFGSDAFHPCNVRMTKSGLVAQECRVLNPVSWKYARVKGKLHSVHFFVKGSEYKLLGFIPCSCHLFGTVPDANGNTYPVFLLGADNLGRDLFSRIVYGSRISLTIGFVASAISLVLAVLLGGLAGFYGGTADWSVMRLAEFFMLIPSLYLILFLRSLLNTQMDSGTAYIIITVILALVGWPGSARTIRGMVHAIKREEFVLDAHLEGIPSTIIIFRHIIPQMSSLLIVSVALSVPGFIMSETTLSYLGLGISDPAVSWGSLINRDISTLNNLRNFPWLLWPVFLLLVVTLAFNFLGDILRDYFDPYHAVFPSRKKWRDVKRKANAVMASDSSTSAAQEAYDAEKNDCACTTKEAHDEGIGTAYKTHDMEAANVALQTTGNMTQAIAASQPHGFLRVEDLRVTFTVLRGAERTHIYAVRGVSFTMKKGEVLGIVGESGSGKSVTTLAIPLLLPSNASVSGHLCIDGVDALSLAPSDMRMLRGKKIGMIFQEPGRAFDPLQSIGSVFWETFRAIDAAITKEMAYEKASALLNEVGLPDARGRLASYPHQFSGGQLQRIGIALALAQGCELLIADEPTTALDVTIQAQIISLLVKLKATRNLSIIFISHDIDVVASIADRIIVMYGGKVMEELVVRANNATSRNGIRADSMATGNCAVAVHDAACGDETVMAETVCGIENARHPYTRALLASSPKFGSHYSKERMKSIPGKVSDPSNPTCGCPFAPRCQFVQAACSREKNACPEMKA